MITTSVFEVEIKSSVSGTMQLFYDIGNGFNEEDSIRTSVLAGSKQIYRFIMPKRNVKVLRLDPIDREGQVSISHARIVVPGYWIIKQKVIHNFPPDTFKAQNHIKSSAIDGEILHINILEGANDPILTIASDNSSTSLGRKQKIWRVALIYTQFLLLFAAGFYILFLIMGLLNTAFFRIFGLSAAAALLAAVLNFVSATSFLFEVELESSTQGIINIGCVDSTRGFLALGKDHKRVDVLTSWTKRTYQFVLPPCELKTFRFDPIDPIGQPDSESRVIFSGARIVKPGILVLQKKLIYKFVPEEFKATKDIKSLSFDGENVIVDTVKGGTDPILEADLLSPLQLEMSSGEKIWRVGLLYLQFLILFTLCFYVIGILAKHFSALLKKIELTAQIAVQRLLTGKPFIPLLLLIIFCAIFFYPYLFEGKTVVSFHVLKGNQFFLQEKWLKETSIEPCFPCYDVLTIFYPWKEEVRKSIKEGYIPLWSSYNEGGTPLLANTLVGYFYPLNFLLGIFSTPVAITIMSVLNVLILSCGIYFLLNVFGAKPIWSLLGAIAASQTAYIAHLFPMIPELGAVVWVPWIIAFMHLAIQRWSIKWLLCSIVATSMSIFSGHVHYSYAAVLLILIYTGMMVFCGLSEVKSSLFKRLLRWGGFIILYFVGVGVLTSPQLIPSWELTQHSIRGKVNLDSLRATAFKTEQIIQLFSRKILGSFDSVDKWGGYPDSNSAPPFIPLCVSGLVLSAFLTNFYKRKYIPLTIVAIFYLGVAFGNKLIFEIAKIIPLFDHFQGPTRIGLYFTFIFVCFAVIFLSAAEEKSDGNQVSKFLKTFPYLLTLLVFVGLLMLLCWKYWPDVPILHVVKEGIRVTVFLSLYQILYLFIKKQYFANLCIIIFLLIASVESITANYTLNSKVIRPESGNVRLQPDLEALGKGGGVQGRLIKVSSSTSYDSLYAPPNLNSLHNVSYLHARSPYVMREIAVFLERAQKADNESVLSREVTYGVETFKPEELESPSLRLGGIRYLYSDMELPQKYKLLADLGRAKIYELPDTLPLVYLLPWSINVESSHSEILKQAQQLKDRCTLDITKIPNGYEAEVKADLNSVVVLGETFYPGWRVWIDQEEKDVFKIGGGFIGAKLPQGSHKVRFEFRPQKFYATLYISGSFWLALIVYFIVVVSLHFKKTKYLRVNK
ncbi:MAG: YfhO family protein [Planctomycetes bacterium]|nr:YfhO family protein [Planctomycetota bacterium]